MGRNKSLFTWNSREK